MHGEEELRWDFVTDLRLDFSAPDTLGCSYCAALYIVGS